MDDPDRAVSPVNPATPNPQQTGAWVGLDQSSNVLYLVRRYADDTLTAETMVDGRYTGEVTLTAAAVTA